MRSMLEVGSSSVSTAFQGSWETRGAIRVPVPAPKPVLVPCEECGDPTFADVCRPCRTNITTGSHGTHASFNRHKNRSETPCPECRDAEREYQRVRKAVQRQAKRAAEADSVALSTIPERNHP
jgi:hypothetical protein